MGLDASKPEQMGVRSQHDEIRARFLHTLAQTSDAFIEMSSHGDFFFFGWENVFRP